MVTRVEGWTPLVQVRMENIMNTTHEMIIAGFGGQGVLSMGQIIAYAAMKEGKEISWMPAYGPEMRGGTANCTVIVSSNRVSSPIVTSFDTGILLNQPSLDKFGDRIKPNGLMICEESTIVTPSRRTDIEIITVPAMARATEMGKRQIANMILLGAFLERRPVVSIDNVLQALREVLPERHHHLIPLNEQALQEGKKLALNTIEHAQD